MWGYHVAIDEDTGCAIPLTADAREYLEPRAVHSLWELFVMMCCGSGDSRLWTHGQQLK